MSWIETLVNNPDIFPPDDSKFFNMIRHVFYFILVLCTQVNNICGQCYSDAIFKPSKYLNGCR